MLVQEPVRTERSDRLRFCEQIAVDKRMLNGGGMALLPSLSLINIFGSD